MRRFALVVDFGSGFDFDVRRACDDVCFYDGCARRFPQGVRYFLRVRSLALVALAAWVVQGLRKRCCFVAPRFDFAAAYDRAFRDLCGDDDGAFRHLVRLVARCLWQGAFLVRSYVWRQSRSPFRSWYGTMHLQVQLKSELCCRFVRSQSLRFVLHHNCTSVFGWLVWKPVARGEKCR